AGRSGGGEMRRANGQIGRLTTVLTAVFGLAAGAHAANPDAGEATSEIKEFFRPELYLSASNMPLGSALRELPNRAAWEAFLSARGEDPRNPRTQAFVDRRSGAVTNIIESVPLVPGDGVGNTLRSAKPPDAATVEKALRAHLKARRDVLGIDAAQLGEAR